jgi:predicted AAA+ superfamily ATPase
MIPRLLSTRLVDALGDRPVTLLIGPRQAGKTTLALAVTEGQHPATYRTFDDPPVLDAALQDPVGFLAGLADDLVLDEAQLAPELFRPLKASVDRDRRPGRFLLTGSAQVLLLPRLSESLAGRMEVLTLWPLAQRELAGRAGSFIDALFAGPRLTVSGADATLDLAGVCSRLAKGGFPEVGTLRDAGRRAAWFESYVTTILQRDVRDISNIEGLVRVPALLSLLAARSAGLLNVSEISRSSGLKLTTLNRYLSLLETVFLIHRLPAWSANVGKRLVKAPKLHLVDTGLAAHLLGLDDAGIASSPQALGALLETFVVTELLKDLGWAETRARLYHFRSTNGRREVDIVIEDQRGRVVGIEVRATSSPGRSDFEGLRSLQELAGERFLRGVVLHLGGAAVPFSERLEAAPLSSLWTASAAPREA